jgi:hypothetical protein
LGTTTARVPFGRPDGGRVAPDDPHAGDPLHDFVYFDERYSHRGLGMDGSDRSVRVIVGKKGAGKTLYLRRLHAFAVAEPSLYADDIQQTYPKTDEVVKVSNWYHGSIVVEKWMAIWKAAILRSVVSHLLCGRRLVYDGPDYESALRSDYTRLYPEFREPHSIYSQVREIINHRSHTSPDRLDRYLADAQWEELEYRLGQILLRCPPMCFYIDAIDEEFRHAPMYWLMCQKGLFYQVLRLLSDARIGGRLHITICVRDIVYSSTQATEHGTRYAETQYIHTLDWDREAIRHFLHEKLARLPRPQPANVADWLGTAEVRNGRRPRGVEDVEAYLLRHTRLIPRDIIVLGNMLCIEIAQRKSRLTDAEIRAVVRRAARKFGDEQIAACANHIASDLMPRQAAELGYADIYTGQDADGFEGGDAYQKGLADDLRGMLATLRTDRFGRGKFEQFAEIATEHFSGKADPISALWQNGLIGYIDGRVADGPVVFYAAGHEDGLRLPTGKRGYALHPIVVDCIDPLRGHGTPVVA